MFVEEPCDMRPRNKTGDASILCSLSPRRRQSDPARPKTGTAG